MQFAKQKMKEISKETAKKRRKKEKGEVGRRVICHVRSLQVTCNKIRMLENNFLGISTPGNLDRRATATNGGKSPGKWRL